jgi:hypothetical protein
VSPAPRAAGLAKKQAKRRAKAVRSGHARTEPTTPEPEDCACQPGQPCLLHYGELSLADREEIAHRNGVSGLLWWSYREAPRR